MKTIKNILKQIDVFAVPLSLRYKGKNYYSTALGGLFIILFIIVILSVGIYYFIPFMKRKNFTIVYYTMNLSKTEQIKLRESQAAFAVGLNCEKIVNGMNVNDVLKLDSKFIVYTKNTDGTFNKNKITLSTHSCGYADFYNNYNNSVDYLNLGDYECLDDNTHTLEGIFSDQVFSYYEFGASAKTGTEQNFQDLDTFLLNNDCKLQIYYTDITIDLVNYEEPIKPYLNTLFIQLDPTLFIKRNMYFMNQYLFDDNYLIWNFGDDDKPTMKTLFSRYEEYALYQGMSRHILKPPDYLNYAKIYIRADTRRTDIKRKYQKLMEFYSDLSAIMITLYRLMIIFFNFVNTFYAMHSVAKRIFFFKNIENKKFNIFNQSRYIQELIYLTENHTHDNLEEVSFENEFKIANSNNKIENEKQQEIKIKNYKNNFVNSKNKQAPPPRNMNKKRDSKVQFKYEEKDQENSMSSKIKNFNNDNRVNSIYRKNEMRKENIYMNQKEISNYEDYIYNLKYRKKKKNNDDNSDNTRMEDYPRRKHKNRKINYKFNILEVICVSIFSCCLPKGLSRKNNINEKANNIIFKKLDLVLYVRNMILLDLLYNFMLSQNKKNILNFLSRPVISLNKNEEYQESEFYKDYKGKDFEQFCESVFGTVDNPKLENDEKRLIVFSNKQLKEILL